MIGLGYICTLLDIFLRSSRVHDLGPQALHIPLIVMSFGLLALVFSGTLFQFLYSSLGRQLSLFTVWALLSVGVSVWPGGAYQYMADVWIPVLPMFVLICGFVRTFEHLRKVIWVTACGYATVVFIALAMRVEVGVGRSGVEGYSLGDANELAMVILFGLPLSVWAVMDKRVSILVKLYLAASAVFAVVVFFRTGSRSGLVTLAAVGLYALYRQSMAVRLRLILAAGIAIPLGVAVTPRAVLDRYTTILSDFGGRPDPIADAASNEGDEVNEDAVAAATASTDSRLALLKRAVAVTLDNPVFGVGPGMFVVAENELAVGAGKKRGYWKASHNAYAQISSELGLPGLILYLILLSKIWRVLGRAERADPRAFSFAPQMRKAGGALKISMLVLLSSGMTLSVGFSSYMPFLCGIAVVIDRILASYRRPAPVVESPAADDRAAPAVRQPEPAMARTAIPAPPEPA